MQKIRKTFRRGLTLFLALLLLGSALLLFTSCKSPTVMTIGGEKVPYDLLKSFVKTYMASYTEEELANEEVREKIRNAVFTDLKNAYAARALAAELGLKLDSSAKKAIQNELDFYRSASDYEEMLEAMYATDEVMEELVTLDYYDDLVYDWLVSTDSRFASDNDTIDADLSSGEWYAAEYVILTVDSVNRETRRKEMEEAREKVLKGTSLRDATEELDQRYASEYVYATDGCFTTSIYSADFEETVKALNEGEISEVVETYTADGYPCLMLLRRTAISDSYVDQNYNDIIAYYLAREYAAYMEEHAASLEIVFKDKYQNLDILTIE